MKFIRYRGSITEGVIDIFAAARWWHKTRWVPCWCHTKQRPHCKGGGIAHERCTSKGFTP